MSYVPRVISRVVEMEYCCGCGVCAGVCRQGALDMQWNAFGELNPILVGECSDCELCTKCCPFFFGVPDEDDISRSLYQNVPVIQYRSETGWYLDNFVGYAPDEERRWKGASGGLLTQVLCHLLDTEVVDTVMVVRPNRDAEKLFTYTVAKNAAEVQVCAKSAYYPTEVADMLRYIIENEGSYAITALPCVAKGLRLAQRHNKKLRERIKYVLGLTCYGQQSKIFTQKAYELFSSREKPLHDKPVEVCYRAKNMEYPAKTTVFTAESADGTRYEMPSTYGFGRLFFSLEYFLNACFHCDDIFAECADATFMDAWLKEYELDPKGTNLVIARNSELARYLRHDLGLTALPIQKILDSQEKVIIRKRRDLARVLQFDKMFGFGELRKRIPIKKQKVTKDSTRYMHIYGEFRLKRFRARNPKLPFKRRLKFHFIRALVKLWNV